MLRTKILIAFMKDCSETISGRVVLTSYYKSIYFIYYN
jgi:hypothetical protein